jgi:predicted nucleic acid-binding protein
MPKYLLDTNVISELTKKVPDSSVVEFWNRLEEITISVITLEEIEFGIGRMKTSKKEILEKWWDEFKNIPPQILPITPEVARISANLRSKEELNGRVITQADSLLSATSHFTGRIFVTRNTKDFQNMGIALLNPYFNCITNK